ncbi:uncharacterized protein N0V89_007127 [Didymosphaeria variabile]|uniref:Glycosyl hydrolase family 13 catalytic domain-containing protein n=1 Tax=Didymosphaeria variabile TaxID=1932322 RepID=A0A9W8XIK8_9PLEO|nr:uncharacterized protein N0V89_007127 [Didymosphaeria variabile]KAJ4351784.1 hypothetical protein N0V89_007127 [Didymosphaeria variabile]
MSVQRKARTQPPGLYVGTDKHRWWKEAVVYQFTKALRQIWDMTLQSISTPGIRLGEPQLTRHPAFSYEDIDSSYGTLADVDNLIKEVKRRDMRLVMDLVVNHTSDQHAWFLDSRSSKTSSKRDWYIWKPARYDTDGNRHPPNNWAQILGEANPAWTWDEQTQEYYLSLFTPEQPDLNWENPDVREAVHNVLRFWLDRGASGFRMDVINLISKVQGFPDADAVVPGHEYQPGDKYFANGPRLHEWLKEINRQVLSQYDTITVGEMPFVRDEDEIIRVVGAESEELNMIFAFDLVDIDNVPGDFKFTLHPWDARDLKRIVTRLQKLMLERDGWNSLFVENHDQPRSVSRYTDDNDDWREVGAKLLCMMQTTLAGTIYVYQGEEIGMRNVPPSWGPEEYKDIESINFFKKYAEMYPNDSEKQAYARRIMQRKARDNARTPVQWDDTTHAGFTSATSEPWMRVNDDYTYVNVEAQTSGSSASTSVHAFWKRSLEYRKQNKELYVYGDFDLVNPDNEPNSAEIMAYRRWSEDRAVLVILNFSGKEVQWDLVDGLKVNTWVAGNYGEADLEEKSKSGSVSMKPWEGLIGELE